MSRRIGWGVGDQLLSSLTNFGLGVLVARSVSLRDFGAFSIIFAIYTSAMGVSRALNSQPLMVRYSHVEPDSWRRATGASAGAAVAVGAAVGAGCVGGGVLVDGTGGHALVALGVCLPGLLLQDAWRWAFFAADRGSSAFLNDLVWGVVMFPAFALLLATDHNDVETLTLAWGASATLAALVGLWQTGTTAHVEAARGWWRDHRDLGPRYVGEFVAMSGSTQLLVFAVAAVGGLGTIAAIRAAHLLFGPFAVFAMGIELVAIPEAVRSLKSSVTRLRSTARLVSIALGGAALLWGAAILLIPDAVGEGLMGRGAWRAANHVIIPIALLRAATGVVAGAITGLRALAAARRSFWVRLLTSPLSIIGGVAGALMGGAAESAWGAAIGNSIAAIVWWMQLHVALRHKTSAAPAEEAEAAPLQSSGDFAN